MSSEAVIENAPTSETVNLGKYAAAAGLVGIILVAIVLVQAMGATGAAEQKLLGSYLYGLVFWTAIALGMYMLTVFNHMTRSTWTLSVLRILEAGGGWITLSILGVSFIPIALKLKGLYIWADLNAVAADKGLEHKAPFLNPTMWTGLTIFFFATWIGTSWAFRRSVMLQEKTNDFQLENRRMSFGAPLFVLFAVTSTFAFVEWIMSLEPKWESTMYALWFIVGTSTGAYGLAVTIFNLNADKHPFSDVVTKNVLKDQGNMLFVHTMLWAYTSLSQYLIIWNGNVPETTSFYARRASMGWNAVGMATIIGQFFVPFFVLLSPRTKKNSQNMRAIAGWIFAVHIIDYTLIVVPALPGRMDTVLGVTPWDLVSWLGFGALFMCGFCLMFKQAPAFPTYDRRLQEAKAHAH